MENFIVIVTLMILGIILRRIRVFPEGTGNMLNLFVIYISLPALILLKIQELVLSTRVLVPAVMPWGMLAISVAAVLILSHWRKWERSTTGCMLLLIPLGNTSFLGIPMVKVFFGDQAVPYAVIYDQLGSFLALAVYGAVIVAVYGGDAGKTSAGQVTKNIIAFPPFMALVLGFLLKPATYPAIMVELLEMLASTLVPVIMTAVGFQLSFRLRKDVRSQLTIGLLVKLVAMPVLALFGCRVLGLSGEIVEVSIFESGMPPMVSAGALAVSARLSPSLTAALVGIGVIASFATLPMLYYLITWLI
ncbi:MAG: AEC family transporter [Desulfobacteraceae bacterium]|nr:AEC family transporter [Desulfobacteraceae bacterium]